MKDVFAEVILIELKSFTVVGFSEVGRKQFWVVLDVHELWVYFVQHLLVILLLEREFILLSHS